MGPMPAWIARHVRAHAQPRSQSRSRLGSQRGALTLAIALTLTAAGAAAAALALQARGTLTQVQEPPQTVAGDWPFYGHDAGGTRYSPLTQINRDNVSALQVAWTFRTGDISDGRDGRMRSGFETTPLLVDETLYLTTPFNRVIALDPATGRQKWAYDPKIDTTWMFGDGLINRGVAAWLDATRPAGAPCRRRIFEATLDARLIALDGATGAPCADFGTQGQVSLRGVAGYRDGVYHMTSPPALIDDLVIVGSAIDDNANVSMPAGVVRAFDARTGALRWSWDPIPPAPASVSASSPTPARASASSSAPASVKPGAGAASSRVGAANAWSVMAVDPERHLVFVPTGSASPDYYGGQRLGDNRWANSVVALHAATGRIAWGFQLVHHDLWDYDTAPPPLLATLPRGGARVPVVIQGNKTGYLYVLHRETGTPFFPVHERPMPKSDVPGEMASPTQPVPVAPPPLAPQTLSAADAWGPTAADRDRCRAWIEEMRNEGVFTPPSVKGTLIIPGNVGGFNWSGYAFDPRRNLLVANTVNLPARVRLIPSAQFDEARRTEPGEHSRMEGAPYGLSRRLLLGPSGLPCSAPPWGTLVGVDMAAGTIRWQVPLGSFDPSNPAVPAGSLSLGGPIVTAGGLAFIAGTLDPFFRAFDVDTGREIWKARLPANGHATPMTYQLRASGTRPAKQFVVIAAGGHAKIDGQTLSDVLVAYALP